jgi:putative membrane protein
MMYWDGDWTWATWLLMTLSMLAFWGLVAWVAVTLVRSGRPAGSDRAGDADQILADRFARGEIDEDEYRHRQDVLHAR